MHGMKDNLIVLLSLIHVSIHVRDVVMEPVNNQPGVQCYSCEDDDPDAKRNVVSMQGLVFLQ